MYIPGISNERSHEVGPRSERDIAIETMHELKTKNVRGATNGESALITSGVTARIAARNEQAQAQDFKAAVADAERQALLDATKPVAPIVDFVPESTTPLRIVGDKTPEQTAVENDARAAVARIHGGADADPSLKQAA